MFKSKSRKNAEKPITIQDLYPELTPKEQEEADMNLNTYLDLIERMYDRMKREGKLEEFKNSLLRHEWEKRSRQK